MATSAFRATCRGCGRERDEEERFSYRGKCRDCAIANLERSHADSGPWNPNWTLAYRRGVAASVGAVLLEDLPEVFAAVQARS